MSNDFRDDPLAREAACLLGHPDFPAAVRTYTTGLARFREAPRFANVLVATDVRWRVVGYLFYLDADRDMFGPEGGSTYGRLLEVCGRRGEASPRELKSTLALLLLSGLVQRTSGHADRRVKLYRPTPRLMEFQRSWMRYGTAALDILEPDMERSRFVDDPSFVQAYCVSGGRAYLADPIPLADRVPAPLCELVDRLGCFSVVLAVLLAHEAGVAAPSRRAIAKRFGLSSTQVDNVLRAGGAKGLFHLDGNGVATPTRTLIDNFREWISIELAFYARHMRPPPARSVDGLVGTFTT